MWIIKLIHINTVLDALVTLEALDVLTLTQALDVRRLV